MSQRMRIAVLWNPTSIREFLYAVLSGLIIHII